MALDPCAETLPRKTFTVHFTFTQEELPMRRTIAFVLLISVTAFWAACSTADNTNSNANTNTAVTAPASPAGTATPSNANMSNMNAGEHANMNMNANKKKP